MSGISPSDPSRAGGRPGRRLRPTGRWLAVVVAVGLGGAAVAGLAGTGGVAPVQGVRVGPETPVTAMDQGLGLSNNSPMLVADPNEPRFVVLANRMDAPDFSCALQVSGDGGLSWAPGDPVPQLPAGAEKCYGPEVAFDARGTLYYLFVGLAGGGNRPMGAFLTTSGDRGRTFAPPRQVLGPLNFGVRLAIGRGPDGASRLHLAWIEARSEVVLGGFGPPPNPVLTAYSDDGGATFSAPMEVTDPSGPRAAGPALAVGPGGDVHIAWFDLVDDARDYQGLEGPVWDGRWRIVLARSTDGGRSYGPGMVVDGDLVPTDRVMLVFTMPPPSLAVGRERVCLGWSDGRLGDPDVFVQCMPAGRAPSGPPRRVNDDPAGNGRSQYLPRLAFAPDGRLDAVFYDRRNSPQNLQNGVSYSYSTDGGSTFAPNVEVTSDGSDVRIGQQYVNVAARGLVEWGARLGLLSTNRRVVAAWTDTRNSRPGTTGQDVFSAAVEVRRSEGPGSVKAVGAGLAAAGVAAGVVAAVRGRWGRPAGVESP